MDNLFSTTAPTDLNSFSDPMNPVNMNPGGWGINPTYLTPSYTASYRPGYQGSNGEQQGPTQPGFFKSASYFLNPFDRSPTHGLPGSSQPYLEAIHSRPIDAAMWASHRIVIPTLATAVAFKAFSGAGGEMGATIATGIGRGIIHGANSFLPPAMRINPVISAGITNSLRPIGAFLGSGALPGVAAWAAMETFSKGIVDPYIAYRKTGESLRGVFANTMVAPSGGGSSPAGFGLNFGTSNRLAGNVLQQGIKDFAFSTKEYGQMADYAGRAGLLDDASVGQISNRVKEIASQIKMVMRVANDPDMKNAVEMLARLKMAGGSGAAAASAMSSIGISSAIAGISTQRMMATSAAQGGYLFQANGMVPLVGQTTGASNMAHFATAFRTGLISPALMASMGGVEGASQSMTTGMINATQTPYSMMSQYNKYLGSGGRSGVMANLAAFGASMTANPMGVYGDMMLNKGSMGSKLLAERGPLAVQDQLMDALHNIPGAVKNNRVSAGTAYAGLTGFGMMGPDEARAYVNLMGQASNPKFQEQEFGTINASERTQTMRLLDQEGVYGPATPAVRTARGMGQMVLGLASRLYTGPIGDIGDALDNFSDKYNDFRFGNLDQQINPNDLDKQRNLTRGHFKGVTTNESFMSNVVNMNLANAPFSYLKKIMSADHTEGNISKINKLLDAGNPLAIKLADKNTTEQERRVIVDQMAKSGFLTGDAAHDNGLIDRLGGGPTENIKEIATTDREQLGGLVNKLSAGSGNKDFFGQIESIIARDKIAAKYGTNKDLSVLNDKDLIEKAGWSDLTTSDKKGRFGQSLGSDFEAAIGLHNDRVNKGSAQTYSSEKIYKRAQELMSSGKTNDQMAAFVQARNEAGLGTSDNVPEYAKYLDPDARRRLTGIVSEHANRRSQIIQMAKDGKIDPNTAGMSLSSDKIYEAGEIMLEAANLMVGKNSMTDNKPSNTRNK